MSDSGPADWHFTVLAPIYDFFMIDKDYGTILDGLDLSEDDRLVDLGGGTGSFCASLIEKDVVERQNCYVVDKSHSMLKQAVGKDLPNVIEGDAESLPIHTASVDAIFMGDTLHHMGNRNAVLREIHRILTSGGRLVIEEFDPGTLLGKGLEYAEWLSGMGSEFFVPDDLIARLVESGFTISRIDRDGFVYHLTVTKD